LDAALLPPARCRLASSSARKIVSGRRRFVMTTDLMQVYSIEVGDILLVNDNLYTVVDADYADDEDDAHILTLVDEEGNRKQLRAPGRSEVRIVVSEYV
jgi:hypothetical protein